MKKTLYILAGLAASLAAFSSCSKDMDFLTEDPKTIYTKENSFEKAAQVDAAEEANKTELQKAQDKAAKLQKELDDRKKADSIREIREKVSKETGVPVNLITADTEEAAKAQADAIKQYADPGHPSVRDGGEVHTDNKQSTREQFAGWLEEVL